ncbi:stage III sporulation protein AF [Desulfonispora thiosulfatigenes DSM 11270]|uniref:Stage III sporulation protein AF n=1 Tax=Desulfonispora thiosulfatigenes DSM 11270 TaxID=656914 RepID=A0A1W1VN76_DESTI|nr:stage III sporulation protein AF [Desulfonispora thiosulfatigenes]SMB94825.1 stage III sporulation protein AF [Desulfonispora thiosulfatigenes DSM 11270]
MSSLNEIIRNIAVIVLLTTFLDMLLPNTNLRKFIKVIMGLFIMVTILNPIISIFTNSESLSAWNFSLPENEDINTVLAEGEKMSLAQNSEATREYNYRIEKQIEALVHLIPEVSRVNCQAILKSTEDLKNMGKLEKVDLEIFLGGVDQADQDLLVEPVKIEFNKSLEKEEPKINNEGLRAKVINLVSNYYSINEEQIYIEFNSEEES